MSTIPNWQPAQIRDLLQARGYDVNRADTRYGDESVSARRERAGHVQQFVLERGGRFRAEVTLDLGESRRTTSIGAVPVVVVTQNQRTLTVTGNLPHLGHLNNILNQIDTLV